MLLKITSWAFFLLTITSLYACSSKPKALAPASPAPQAVKGEIALLLESKSGDAWRLRRQGASKEKLSCDGSDATAVKGASLSKQLRLKDGSGNLIATGTIQDGTTQKISPSGACVFQFAITSAPQSDFYTLEIDPYGSLSFSRQDLTERQWTLGITVDTVKQTLSDDLAQIRQETEVKRKEYDVADRLTTVMEDTNSKIKAAEEKVNQKHQETLFCIDEQELANFSLKDNKVLSSECRKQLAKAGSLENSIK